MHVFRASFPLIYLAAWKVEGRFPRYFARKFTFIDNYVIGPFVTKGINNIHALQHNTYMA